MDSVDASSNKFRGQGNVRVIGPGGKAEIVTVPMDPVITKTEIDPKSIDDLFNQTLAFLRSGLNSKESSGIRIEMPLINSGGRSYGSILHVVLIPHSSKLIIFLERVEDKSAGTICGEAITYDGNINPEFKEKIRKKLTEVLIDSANILATRASLREGYSEWVARTRINSEKKN